MAQATVSMPARIGGDLEGQTRYLFHRYVHEATRQLDDASDSGAFLNARAFEEMNVMEPRLLFGPDPEVLDELVGCLAKHARSIQNDVRLQEVLGKIRQHFNRETLWDLCKKIFTNIDDLWTAILTLFAFGLELCRQVAIVLYETVVDTITEAVMKWASTWLVNNGGWVALTAGQGFLSGVFDVVASSLAWLVPTFESSGGSAELESAEPTPFDFTESDDEDHDFVVIKTD